MYQTLIRIADAIARGFALFGGAMLIALTALTCVSILGRAFVPLQIGLGPVPGIYEITEMAIAVAVFCFLPWVQVSRGHAGVDLLSAALPGRVNRFTDLLVDLGMTTLAVVLGWRTWLGMLDRVAYGDTTQILGLPLWPGYAAGVLGCGAFAFVSAICALRSARGLIGRAA